MRGAIVLAGGPGRRMGRPKALVPLAGKPLVAWVVDAARRLVDEVVVVTKRPMVSDVRGAVPRGIHVRADDRDLQSPLVGLVAGARPVSAEYVAYLACDLPFLSPALLEDLFARAQGADAAIPRWPDGRLEPMAAVYRRDPAHPLDLLHILGRRVIRDQLAGFCRRRRGRRIGRALQPLERHELALAALGDDLLLFRVEDLDAVIVDGA